MANVVVIGMQWGDEGKGKVVDLLCSAFDAVVRYQGGHNAGHTVKFADRHFALHLVPSGILHEGMQCVLGNGMVISPPAFFKEVDGLREMKVDVAGRLFVSERAQVILPQQVALDAQRETASGREKIGTTIRGIGPAYEVKAARFGVRVCDLDAGGLEERLRAQLHRLEAELTSLGGEGVGHPERIADECRGWAEQLRPFRRDTSALLASWMREGRSILFEGAQGTLLDVDHGTYPYVTSSNSVAGGVCTGAGVAPTRIDGALGVLKAYTTRVGGGPFPTEEGSDRSEQIRQRGNEFGTTTGRPRRCGWLDLVAARYSARINGLDAIALTKLDVLDSLDEIPVCLGYRYQGELLRDFPASLEALEGAEPEYRVFPGWRQDTSGVLDFSGLPAEARSYIDFIEQQLEAPVVVVSTGPRREETILRPLPALERLTGGLRLAGGPS